MIFGMDLSGGQSVTEPLVCRVEELKFSIARILAPDFGRRNDCKRGAEGNVYFGGSFADGKPSHSLLSTLYDPMGIRGPRSDSPWKQFEQDRFRSHDKHLFLDELCSQLSPAEVSPYTRYDQFFNNALKSPDDSVGGQRNFTSNDASIDSKERKSKRCLLFYSPLDQAPSDDVKPFFSSGLDPGVAGRGNLTSPENFRKLYISESCTDSSANENSPSPGEDLMKDSSVTEDSKDFTQNGPLDVNHSAPSPEKDLAKPLAPPQDSKDVVQDDTLVRDLSFLPSGKDFRNTMPVLDDDKGFNRDGGRCSPEDSRCSTTPDSSSSGEGSDSNHSRSVTSAIEESRLCLVEAKSTDSASGAISGDLRLPPPGSDSKGENEKQKSGGNCDVELEGNDSWPVWVYCSRYSPRPSSGPRSRRQPKKSPCSDEKRCRTAFSGSQLARLRIEFQENPYLSENRRLELARDLHLTESQVKIWFQNRRAKLKKASGQKNPLAMKLMEQGLYNHSTNKT